MMQPQPEAEGLEASGKSLVQVIIQRLNSNGSSKKKKKSAQEFSQEGSGA
jgi:hypothetical protein